MRIRPQVRSGAARGNRTLSARLGRPACEPVTCAAKSKKPRRLSPWGSELRRQLRQRRYSATVFRALQYPSEVDRFSESSPLHLIDACADKRSKSLRAEAPHVMPSGEELCAQRVERSALVIWRYPSPRVGNLFVRATMAASLFQEYAPSPNATRINHNTPDEISRAVRMFRAWATTIRRAWSLSGSRGDRNTATPVTRALARQ